MKKDRVITIHLLQLPPAIMSALEEAIQTIAATALFLGGNFLVESKPMETADVTETFSPN
jgi:hypothetical protein